MISVDVRLTNAKSLLLLHYNFQVLYGLQIVTEDESPELTYIIIVTQHSSKVQ